MNVKRIICTFLSAALIFVCLPFSVNAEDTIKTDYAENQIVFEYSESFQKAYNFFVIEHPQLGITDLKLSSSCLYTSESEPMVYIAQISGDVTKTCHEVESVKGVTYAEPNYIYTTDSFTMPVEISKPTNMYTNYCKWYLDDILHIPAAWQKYETTGENVVVAVIDNGFNLSAVDFPIHLWDDGNGNHGWNTHLNSNDISPIYSSTGDELADTSHGSNVAGIIGMASNSLNTVGAAYGSTLMLLNAATYVNDSSRTSFLSSDIASAVRYATANGADIINMSLGSSSCSSTIKSAIDAAYNAGIAVIAAAGNGDGTENGGYIAPDILFYPAALPNVIGVMAIDKTDPTQLAGFSNYDPTGNYYDISAPGVEILGCHCVNNSTSVNSGTSQASPLVAACAALYLSAYPDATVDNLYNAIRNSPTKTVNANSNTDSTAKFKSLDAVELLDYNAIKPKIVENANTNVLIDPTRNYIYGLDENYADIASYLTVTDGTGSLEFIPTTMGNGTGSIVNIYTIKGELYKSYKIIVFGDVNGDAIANGEDTVIITCIINNMTTYPDWIQFAADVDFNNTVNDDDMNISFDYAIGKDYIFQLR